MADVYTRIGYIKGATGATGAQGEKGDTGDAATIQVGSVTTVPYGQTANVVNSGTEQAAVFDFTIPQGRPGQQVTEMDNLLLNSITTSAAEFPLPAVGETGKVLWGKVVKWFRDMTALVATKLNAANVVNNLTTTSSGYALDARQANPNVANSLASKLFYKAGDTVTFAYGYLTHFVGVTVGTDRIRFTIPLSRPVLASHVSMSGDVVIKDANGHNAMITLGSGNTVDARVLLIGCGVQLQFSSAHSFSANVPVDVQDGGLTITFS